VKIAPELRGQGNQRNMARIDEPLLLLVGAEDKTTPPLLSQQLYRQSWLPGEQKTLVVVTGAGHNDVLAKVEAQQAYRVFLERVLSKH
jgi:pimeloyl-ACP methyl ester carboxylesterase